MTVSLSKLRLLRTSIGTSKLMTEGLVFGGLTTAFLALLVSVPHAGPSALDATIMRDVQNINWGKFAFIPTLGSDIGGGVYGTYLVPGIAGLWFAATRRWRLLGLLALVFALHYLLISPKLFITAYRPSSAFGVEGAGGMESFPSGHVQWATSFYGFLALLAWRNTTGRVRWLIAGSFALVVMGTMLGRMELGRHWPVDVTAGLIVGLIALRILSLLHRPASSRPEPARVVEPSAA